MSGKYHDAFRLSVMLLNIVKLSILWYHFMHMGSVDRGSFSDLQYTRNYGILRYFYSLF